MVAVGMAPCVAGPSAPMFGDYANRKVLVHAP